MDLSNVNSIEDLDHEHTAKLVLDMFHRIIIHYALWFNEVKHQMGMEKALDILNTASKRGYDIQMKRLSKVLGFEMKDNIPLPLLNMPKESLTALMDSVAANWVVNDGVWFQAVEFTRGMNDAKTGISRARRLSSTMVSKPFIPGILMSRIITSYVSFTIPRTSSPFITVST